MRNTPRLPDLGQLPLHPSVATGAPKRKRPQLPKGAETLEAYKDGVRRKYGQAVLDEAVAYIAEKYNVRGWDTGQADAALRELYRAEHGGRIPDGNDLLDFVDDKWQEGIGEATAALTRAQAQMNQQEYNDMRAEMDANEQSKRDAGDDGKAYFDSLSPEQPAPLSNQPEYKAELERKEGTLAPSGPDRGSCMAR